MNVQAIRGLYGVADADCRPEMPMEEKVLVFLEGGATAIQLRMKGASGRRFYEVARRAREIVGGKALLIVNDRPDVAIAARADGIHVGDEDLPVEAVRQLVGTRMLVGASARTLAEALAVAGSGADHIGFGPVFPTVSKSDASAPQGLAQLVETVQRVALPVVAIGGITADNAGAVARAGAQAAAVISDVLLAPDMRARAKQIAHAFTCD